MDHSRRIPAAPPSYSPSDTYPATAPPHLEQQYHPLFSIQTRAGALSLRDATPSDLDAYVNYWHYSGEKIKNLLGIDCRKLGTPEDTRERFFNMIRVPGTYQRNVIFTITLNSQVVGYTNINQHGLYDNYAHLHTYRSSIRSALKKVTSTAGTKVGAGLAAPLIGPILGTYFRLYPIHRVVLQTRPENRAINKALDLYKFPTEKKYVERPAGLAAPGEQCLRYVYKKDVPDMLRRAELLAKLVDPTGLKSWRESGEVSNPGFPAQWMQQDKRPVQ